jgi:tetratricopeptide (TPR) repeat protein
MQGLRNLYEHMGRRAEWARLVAEVRDDFVDPATDGPLPGREEEDWGLVNDYRVRLAREARQWAEAERLQQAQVRVARERADAALVLPAEALDAGQRNRVRSLAVSLETLGHIQRGCGNVACVPAYKDAFSYFQRISAKIERANIAISLGNAYMTLPAVRDLAEAERWYRSSLDMRGEEQRHGRAVCLNQLGAVAREHFKEARAAQRPEKELLEHLNVALRSYHEALALFPPDAVDELAVTHAQLGNIYGDAGDLDRALPHYQDAIRYREKQGDLYRAAQTRFNVAVDLARAGRLPDARAYALAALRNYETYGDRAADEIQRTRRLLAHIDRRLTPSQPT